MTTLPDRSLTNTASDHESDHDILHLAHSRFVIPITWPSDLQLEVGTMRLRLGFAYTILDFLPTVGTAPVGAAILFDVNRNGTTLFTTQAQRPTIAAAANNGNAAPPEISAIGASEYLTFDIDQVGSTTAGADACLVMRAELA